MAIIADMNAMPRTPAAPAKRTRPLDRFFAEDAEILDTAKQRGVSPEDVEEEIRVKAGQARWSYSEKVRFELDRLSATENRAAPVATAGKYTDEADAASQLTTKYIFVRSRNAYLEKATGLLIEPAALNADEAHRMPVIGVKVDQATGKPFGGRRLIAANVFNESSSKTSVHDLGYHPSKPLVYQSRQGYPVVNSYQPPDYEPLEPTDAEREMWSAYLQHLFPDLETNAGANVILDSMAWLAANPGGRLRYKTILAGRRKGSGKSVLFNLVLALLIGARNHREVGRSETASRFIDYIPGHRVVYEDEIFDGDPGEAEERFNMRAPWLTSDTIAGDLKGVKGVLIENVVSFFATSNYPDRCGFIPDDDRRILLVETFAGELPERLKLDFIEGVLRGPRGAGVVATLLAERDISKFDPHRRPITTTAKKIARITQQVNDLQVEILAAFEEGQPPFDREFAPAADVRECLIRRGFRDHAIPADTKLGQQIRKAFEAAAVVNPNLKCVRMDTQVRGIGGDRGARLWAWRNADRWEKAIATDIREYWDSGARAANEASVKSLKAKGRPEQARAVEKLMAEGRAADAAARQKWQTKSMPGEGAEKDGDD